MPPDKEEHEDPSAAAAEPTLASTTTTVRWIPTCRALTRKNVLLLWAAPWSLLMVFALPLAAVGLTFGLQRIAANNYEYYDYNDYYYGNNNNNRNNNDPQLLHDSQAAVERCAWYDVYGVDGTDACATIVFASVSQDTDAVNQVMATLAAEANLPFYPSRVFADDIEYLSPSVWSGGSIVGVPSLDALGEFLVQHPGRAQSVLYFATPIDLEHNNNNNNNGTTTPQPQPLIHFRFNTTGSYDSYYSRGATNNGELIPWALQRAFLTLYQGGTADIQIRISKRNLFGMLTQDQEEGDTNEDTTTTNAQDEQDEMDAARQRAQEIDDLQRELVSYLFGPIFMFAIAMSTAMLANHAAAEKTTGLIGSLRVVGAADSAYWMSWWVTVTVVVLLPSCLLSTALMYALDVALLTDVNALAVVLALLLQYSSLLAWQFLAVAVATSRPFLYALYFCILCLSVTAVSLANTFQAGPEDVTGRVFQYLVPGYNLGGILDSMHRYQTRFGEAALFLPANVTTPYEFDRLFQPFGMCNQTLLGIDPANCQDIDVFDDAARVCWTNINCRDDYIWDPTRCAPESCYFTPLSDIARLVLMLVQSLVFMALAWYALQVIPSGNGLTYRPWFLFTPQYWRGNSSPRETENSRQRHSRDTQSIVLGGLTKAFKNQKAVNNVDMEIESGQVSNLYLQAACGCVATVFKLLPCLSLRSTQVFVLLGHNGAGKTTLINMLTGKLSPTSGEAYVLGLSLQDNIHSIQRMTSCVPQHDLLWDDLSAAEHIRMFAQIKGVARRDVAGEIEKVLRKVHLADSANQPAGGYSGGMKRRLSIALAGIGGPKIIMLDEPTTGMLLQISW